MNGSPAVNKRDPLHILFQMAGENITGRSGRLGRGVEQMHLRLFKRATAFMMVAAWAGGNQVIPSVLSPQMARDDVIDRQGRSVFAAVLAGIVISAQDLTLGELDARARSFYHSLQTNNRRSWVRF